MGEQFNHFEELKKFGTKQTRAVESELQKKKQLLEYEENQRRKQEEAQRRRKEAETQKLLRDELQRRKLEEEQRKRDVAAQLRAKERAKVRERELEREKELQERARKQRANASAPTYSRSNKPTYSGSSSRSYEPSKPTIKKDVGFEHLQRMAQSSATDRPGSRTSYGIEDRPRHGDRDSDYASSRQAAVERLKVNNRGISPERSLTSSQSFSGTKILKRPPVKRSNAPKSMFPAPVRSLGAGINPVRDAGLKAVRDGPVALNTKKRDLRSFEEVSAELRDKDARRGERAKRMQVIEEERERLRQQREKALQGAKYSRALMGDDANETERVFKEVVGDAKTSSRRERSSSASRSPSPRRKGRSQSPVQRRRSRSPIRRKRSASPVRRKRSASPVRRKRSASPAAAKKRSYSPEVRRRSMSPRRRRSASPPAKRKMNRDLDDRDRGRDRDRDRDREQERERDRIKGKASNGAARRRVSRSPSPRPAARRSNGRGRGPFEEDMSVSSVIGSIFGTRYRARVEDEDLSDDMEARPDEVFREEARSARIARKEDEEEAEKERLQTERARKRKMERAREKERGR